MPIENEYILFFVKLKNKLFVNHKEINERTRIEILRMENEKPNIFVKIKPHKTWAYKVIAGHCPVLNLFVFIRALTEAAYAQSSLRQNSPNGLINHSTIKKIIRSKTMLLFNIFFNIIILAHTLFLHEMKY